MEIEIYYCEENNREFKIVEKTTEWFKPLIGDHFEVISLYGLLRNEIVLVRNPLAFIEGNTQKVLWIGTEWIYGNCFLAKLQGADFVSLNEQDKTDILDFVKEATK